MKCQALRGQADRDGDEGLLIAINTSEYAFKRHFHEYYTSTSQSGSPQRPCAGRATNEAAYSLGDIFDDPVEDSCPTDELQRYLDEKRAQWHNPQDEPLKWWARNQFQYPAVARFARDIFSIQGM